MSKILIPIILGLSLHAQVYQRNIGTGFRSSGAPGTILASRYGDIYIDTAASNVYVCTDPASYCSGVTAGEWVLTSGSGGGGGAGTVTSVGLSLPAIFTISGSPVTGSGTLTGTLTSQSANLLFASPSGSSGTPSFRALTALDLPATVVQTNTANTYSGGALQDLSAMKLKLPTATVATLPSAASNTGVSYIVTDGGSPSDCTVGTGSTRVNCISNGTAWVSLGGVGTALGDPGSNGLVVRTSAYITTARTLTAGSARISVSNGDGVAGNPTVNLGTVASTDLSDSSSIVKNNQANTYSGGGLQDFSAMKTKPSAVVISSLPAAAANTNVMYLVTDATSLTDCSSGGGSTRTWCVSNGTSWNATTASSTGLGDPGSNSVVYRNGAGTSTPATATNLSGPNFCVDAGATDDYACSLSPAIASYTDGLRVWVKVNTSNTGASTLNLNGLGVKNIFHKGFSSGTPNDRDFLAGNWYTFTYDGTQFLAEVDRPYVGTIASFPTVNSQVGIVSDALYPGDCTLGGGTTYQVCTRIAGTMTAVGSFNVVQSTATSSGTIGANELVAWANGATKQVVVAPISSSKVAGIMPVLVGTGTTRNIVIAGETTCSFDGATTRGNLFGMSTTTAGKCKDLGTTSASAVSNTVQILGWVTETIGSAGNAAVHLEGTNQFGGRIDTTTTTNITGVLKGTGSLVAAAVSGTDFIAPGGAGSISGLTSTRIPKANSSTSLTDSPLTVDGTTNQITSTSSINGPAPSPITFSATPTFDLSTCSRCEMAAMTANVTSVTLTNPKPGLKFSLTFLQDATGGRTVTGYTVSGGSVSNACLVDPTASARTTCQYEVASDGVTIRGVGGSTDVSGVAYMPEAAAPGTPATGNANCWADSTDHWGLECKANNSSTVYSMLARGAGNGFVAFTGPTTSAKTFTLPNASSTILTSNAAVTVAQGGTGIASGTSGGVPYFSGSTTIASSGALTANAVVLGGGAGAAPTSSSLTASVVKAASGVLSAATAGTDYPGLASANTYSGGVLQDFSAVKVKPGTTTVASLPSAASNSGVVYLVTDAASLTDCSTGAGSTRTWCVSNGTSWNAMTASSTGLGDPGSNGVVYRNGSGTSAPATLDNIASSSYCSSVTGTDAYACSMSPTIAAYTTGSRYFFKADVDNTNAASVNFNSIGVKTILDPLGRNLKTGDIRAGNIVQLIYDGTNMILQSAKGQRWLGEYVVGNLSGVASPSASDMVLVFDGLTSTDCLYGGGTLKVVCEYTGSAWKAFGTIDATALPNSFVQQVAYPDISGVTQYTLVEPTSSSLAVKTATSGSQKVMGVALQTKAFNVAVGIQTYGEITCTADNTITINNLIGSGTSTAGRCRDLGTADINTISTATQVIGIATSSATVGNAFTLRLFGGLKFGQRVTDSSTLTNISGIVKGNGTTLLAAVAGTDYTSPTSTETMTNKTLTSPVISSISNSGTITIPTGTDTLVGKATTDTLTNKTLNAEGTGNTLTVPVKIWLPMAGCNNATAALAWDSPTTNPAVAACVTGTNTQKGVADFADGANALSLQTSIRLPSDWTGALDADFLWFGATTTGNVVWQLATICVADAETDDPAFNTASTVTDAAKGTANQLNNASITSVTTTGCAAGELMHLKVIRDPANASDTYADTARLIGITLTMRRAM